MFLQDDSHANERTLDVIGEASTRRTRLAAPPKATLSRRAQSYSDFHDAAKAILRRDDSLEKGKAKDSYQDIKDDLEFEDWYHDLENDLLDASHEEYTYVGHVDNKSITWTISDRTFPLETTRNNSTFIPPTWTRCLPILPTP